MLINFEQITEDLTEEENSYLPDIKKGIEIYLSASINKPIRQKELVEMLNQNLQREHGPIRFNLTVVRLRKFFNYFRSNGIIPIIATSEGCYITNNKEEIEKQILSLEQRAKQILRAADGMKKLLL